jgi:hypothetical protein
MKYKIPEEKIRKIVFKFLDNLPKLQGISQYEVNPGLYDFHKWSEEDEDFYDLDPPFRYYTEEYFDEKKEDYPSLMISDEVANDIMMTFGYDIKFIKYVVDWFEEKYKLPVNSYEY